MSKEAEARVRDELLQTLYASVLHADLAAAQRPAGRMPGAPALAAGMCAVLREGDLLLLPRGGAGAFRALRKLAPHAESLPRRDLEAGVLALPREDAAAADVALGAAAALAHADNGKVVCVLLPPRAPLAGLSGGQAAKSASANPWDGLAATAAQLQLPLLLLADYPKPPPAAPQTAKPPHRLPAPAYPSIPVDREDALAAYRVAYECTARARAGGGPSRIDAVPFRLRGQPAPPDALLRLETMLRKRGAFPKSWRRRLERDIIAKLGG